MRAEAKEILLSVCTYKDDVFEVYIRNRDTEEEIVLSGVRKLTEEEFDLINSIAPACIFTEYTRKVYEC